MLKLNKKGFALVETLIVTVFVATIFTIMYTNFFPMIGEYERRENYDDVDSIYRTYLLKRMFENYEFKTSKEDYYIDLKDKAKNDLFYRIFSVNYDEKNDDIINSDISTGCNNLTNTNKEYCIKLMTKTKVSNIYLTTYKITDLKKKIKSGSITKDKMNMQMQDYIDTLPYFINNPKEEINHYRIIVQYANEQNKESEKNRSVIYSFSTIGVNL